MKIIVLNIGGQTFQTTRQTLCQAKPNFFTQQLLVKTDKGDKNHTNPYFTYKESKGPTEYVHYFLDRDPEMFGSILSFLRGNRLVITAGPLSEKHNQIKLLEESRFYGISALTSTLEKVLAKSKTVPTGSFTQHTYGFAPGQDPETSAPLASLWQLLHELKSEWLNLTHSNSTKNPKYPTGYNPNLTADSPFSEIQDQIVLFRQAIQEIKLDQKVRVARSLLGLLGPFIEKCSPHSAYAKNFNQDLQQFLDTQEDEIHQAIVYYSEQEGDTHPYLALAISIVTFMFTRALFKFQPPADQSAGNHLAELTESDLIQRLADQFELIDRPNDL